MKLNQNTNLLNSIFQWAKNKSWWWRLPILLWFVYLFRKDYQIPQPGESEPFNPISAFNLGIHELGHVLFSAFGQFMHILGGSLFQVLFPLIWLGISLKRKWYFAASMTCCWIGMNFYEVAVYTGDARSRLLPLATGPAGIGISDGDTAAYDQGHDWFQILSRTHHLNSDTSLSHMFRNIGTAFFILGLSFGTFLILLMIYSSLNKLQANKT
jgi:hypothetical protein